MKSHLPGEDRVIASLGVTKSSVSEVTNAGLIVAPSPSSDVNEKGDAFARFRWEGVRTVYIALCLLLPVIAAVAWRLIPLSGSSAADPSVGETASHAPTVRGGAQVIRRGYAILFAGGVNDW